MMQALQSGSVVCSFTSLLLFLIALGSVHWVADSNRTIGLWKFCVHHGVNSGCRSLGTDVNFFVHITRIFMMLGMPAAIVSFIGLCGKYFDFQFGIISRGKISATASLVAAVCILIAMVSYTGNVGSLASYGWSFGLAWTSFPLFLITGLALQLHREVTGLTIRSMQALQIVTVVCAFINLLLLLTALGSDYWLVIETTNRGLWKICFYIDVEFTCIPNRLDVEDFIHVTRAFMFSGMFAGAVACIGLCGTFSGLRFRSISKAKVSAVASMVAALCVLIAMTTYTGQMRQIPYFGWSFGLAWATVPLFFITGMLAFWLNASATEGGEKCAPVSDELC